MDLERFARIVYDRRTELGFTQQQVADRGGPTDTTMGKIENGEWTPGNRHATLRKLDIGLAWARGSAKRALEGGDPTPLFPDSLENVVDLLSAETNEIRAELHNLREQGSTPANAEYTEREDALQKLLARLEQEKRRAQRGIADNKMVDLWLLALPLGQPDPLSREELTDAAVRLARQVAAHTEAAVGGYSRMQELAQARIDELNKEEEHVLEAATSMGGDQDNQQAH